MEKSGAIPSDATASMSHFSPLLFPETLGSTCTANRRWGISPAGQNALLPNSGTEKGRGKRPQFGETLRTENTQTRESPHTAGFQLYIPTHRKYTNIMAERAGFEPAVGYYPTHAFQACDLNHSSISPADGHSNRSFSNQQSQNLHPSVLAITAMARINGSRCVISGRQTLRLDGRIHADVLFTPKQGFWRFLFSTSYESPR